MSPIEIIFSLKTKYQKKHLNEADTRFKIIDSILLEILKWEKAPLMLEVIKKNLRADYVLYGKNSKPILIIESKRSGTYFELPNNINSTLNYQKITVEKLLSVRNLKEAIDQVKDYCEELGCTYGAVCNGNVWVFFSIISIQGIPWKKLPAFVIRDISFFSENYTSAINIFSYHNIVNNGSLKNNIGITRLLSAELFFPKTAITAYDTPVNSNLFASFFNSITRKFFGNIPLEDDDFFQNCYVTNKGHYDDLQKNIDGLIYDSLTPFFKNQGFRNFDDNKKGGAFIEKIEELMRRENLDNVMILFGGRGSGKSTFFKRLVRHLKPRIINRSVTSLVDLIDSAQIADDLSREIWQKVLVSIDKDKLLQGTKEELLILFEDRYHLYQKQILAGLVSDTLEYQRLVNEFLKDTLQDKKYCCERISKYWKAKNKGLIIVLDNMDQLPVNLQDVSFLNANEIAKKLSCLVIISMREERYYNAKSKGVLDAYATPGFHITSPVIPEVISKRIIYAIQKLSFNQDLKKEIGIINNETFVIIKNFLTICNKESNRKDSDLSKFLRFSTHGDVRQALEFFTGFLQSGYTNILEMASKPYFTFQIHQVVKPMMIPNRLFYDEKSSKMPNLYQLRNEVNSSHFCGLRILNILNNRNFDKATSGFYDVKYLIQKFETDYDLKIDCQRHLDIFLSKGVIESNNRLEEFDENVDQVKITSFGKYLLDYLVLDFTYLDLVSLDCGLFDEALSNYMVNSANKEVELYHEKHLRERVTYRLNRVEKFIDYLEKQEEKEFENLGLGDSEIRFSKKLKEQFETQRKHVLKSAKRQENYANPADPEFQFDVEV